MKALFYCVAFGELPLPALVSCRDGSSTDIGDIGDEMAFLWCGITRKKMVDSKGRKKDWFGINPSLLPE